MISDTDLLVLAYRLAVLTFSLGALIYALPIPLPGLKRWAPRLIVDSMLVVVIIVGFDALFGLADRIAQLAGGSWQYFNSWLAGGVTEFLAMKGLRIAVEAIPDPIGITDAILAILRPIDKLATTGLYFLGFIGGLGLLVHHYGRFLAALGAVLVAVPFRVSRAAGAWLISFSLVFTLGLQILPVFVSSISNPPTGSIIDDMAIRGIALARLNVTGWTGPLEGELHVVDFQSKEEYAIYLVDNGQALNDKGISVVSIPSRPDLVYELHYEGVIFYLVPYPVNQSDYKVRGGVWELGLESPYTVKGSDGLLIYTNGTVSSASDDGSKVEATISLTSGGYVEVRYADQCSVTVSSPGLERSEGSWEWRGVEGHFIRLVASSPGEYNIKVDYSCQPPSFKIRPSDYASWMEGAISFFNINFLEAYINYWFTIPFLYIAILSSASAGLARLIGGRERLPIKLF